MALSIRLATFLFALRFDVNSFSIEDTHPSLHLGLMHSLELSIVFATCLPSPRLLVLSRCIFTVLGTISSTLLRTGVEEVRVLRLPLLTFVGVGEEGPHLCADICWLADSALQTHIRGYLLLWDVEGCQAALRDILGPWATGLAPSRYVLGMAASVVGDRAVAHIG